MLIILATLHMMQIRAVEITISTIPTILTIVRIVMALEDAQKTGFVQREGLRVKVIQNKKIWGARSLSPTKIFKREFSNANISCRR